MQEQEEAPDESEDADEDSIPPIEVSLSLIAAAAARALAASSAASAAAVAAAAAISQPTLSPPHESVASINERARRASPKRLTQRLEKARDDEPGSVAGPSEADTSKKAFSRTSLLHIMKDLRDTELRLAIGAQKGRKWSNHQACFAAMKPPSQTSAHCHRPSQRCKTRQR